MKKFPKISLILLLAMVLQLLCVPALATETDEQTDASEITQYTIPENITGDASVTAGCNTIDAQVPLVNPSELEVDLSAAMIYEINSDTLLYGKNIDERMYPASITKVMTCLVALEHGNLEDTVTVSQEVINNRDPDGSSCNLIAGEEMSLRDMLYCMLVASANDAGSAISEHIAGSEEAFVELMNQKAQELGCTNTHFVNPHGLHDDDHYSTARDLAKILMAALEHELFNEMYSAKAYEVPATNKSEARTLITTNYMISRAYVEQYYDERVIGGKTGYTSAAGRCLVAVAESGDLKLLTVALGGKTDMNKYQQVTYGSFEETGKMLSHAFDTFTYGQILNSDAVLTAFPVSGGANNTQAYVKESVTTALSKEAVDAQVRYEYVLDDGTLTAPVEKDELLGVVRVWYQSKCIAEEKMYAAVRSEVKQAWQTPAPAIENQKVQEESDVWQTVLFAVLAVLALIVALLLISGIRRYLRNVRREKLRRQRRRQRVRSR